MNHHGSCHKRICSLCFHHFLCCLNETIFKYFRSISVPASIPASSTGSPKVKPEIDESTFKFDVQNRRSNDESASFSELLCEPESLSSSTPKYYFYSTPEDIQEEKESVRFKNVFICLFVLTILLFL